MPNQSEPITRQWLDVKAVCAYTGMGMTKIQEIFRRSDFPAVWVGRKKLVNQIDLDKYLKEGRAS